MEVGEIITVGGAGADGSIGDACQDLKKWRVERIEKNATYLTPLNDDLSVDEFNAACGEYKLTNEVGE